MWRRTNNNLSKNFVFSTALLCFTPLAQATVISCQGANPPLKALCAASFKALRQQFENRYLTAHLISDAPTRLLVDTQQMWLKRTQQCQSKRCYQQQAEQRIDEFNSYIVLNQSLTQHYLKVTHGRLSTAPVHLKVHQLTKDSIKIEGMAYRNPNNRPEQQAVSLLAYTTPQEKHRIVDNEHDCHYEMSYSKAILVVKTEQKGCERFSGVYRLYD